MAYQFLLKKNPVENLEGQWLIQILFLLITCEFTWDTYVFSSLAYLVFHQVNYQNKKDTKLGS